MLRQHQLEINAQHRFFYIIQIDRSSLSLALNEMGNNITPADVGKVYFLLYTTSRAITKKKVMETSSIGLCSVCQQSRITQWRPSSSRGQYKSCTQVFLNNIFGTCIEYSKAPLFCWYIFLSNEKESLKSDLERGYILEMYNNHFYRPTHRETIEFSNGFRLTLYNKWSALWCYIKVL